MALIKIHQIDFSGSASYTGSLQGTASYAITASYALNVPATSSYALSASYAISSSYAATASYVQNAQSASYAATASYATTASYAASGSYTLTAISASYASTASYVILAQTASYVTTAQTASYVQNAVSSSFSTTASYAVTASYAANVPATASYALQALSSSYALTASYASNVPVTSSYALSASVAVSASYAFTSSITQQVSTSISTQNIQHNVLFVDTSGPGYIQVDGGLRYNPNQDLLTTTSSYSNQSLSSSYAATASYVAFNPSYSTGSFTGSFTGSSNLASLTAASAVITGNVTVLGTASINTLIVNQTQLSTGSNQLGDAADDFQTLYGTVRIPTGSLNVTGSVNVTGSLTLGGNIQPSINNIYNIGAPSFRFSNVYASSTVYTGGLRGTALNFGDEVGTNFGRFSANTGNFILQNGGTFTDNGYKLQINTTGSESGSLFIGGTNIASGSIARTMLISSSLSASANSDTLIGLDINPTFNTGSFTSVLQRFASFSIAGSNKGSIGWDTAASIFQINSAGRLDFNALGNQIFFNSNNTFFQSALNINRTGQASSTITQAGSYSLVFQTSLWNGSSGLFRYGSFKNIASTTVNLDSRFSYFGNGTNADGTGATEYLSIFGLTGNTVIQNGGTFTDNGYKLQINSSGSASGSLYISGSNNQTLLKVDSPSSSNILFISGSGNVGIGTNNPAVQLDLVGQYKQTSVSGVTGLYYISTANANQVRGVWDFFTNTAVSPDFFGRFGFKFEGGTADSFKQYQIYVADSTTPKMVIDGAGNIGIGTIAPTSRLQVKGSGTTSATTALTVQNANASSSLVVLDNGTVYSNGPGYDINNTVFGLNAFSTSASGSYITAFGTRTLQSNNGGTFNVAVGGFALNNNTVGSNNTAVGYNTQPLNSVGGQNTSLGHESLRLNTSGSANVAIGVYSLYSNVIGVSNVAVGNAALFSNSGSYNIAVGNNTLYKTTGSYNVAIGHSALNAYSGSNAVAVGFESLRDNISGSANTAVGYQTLRLSTGVNNTALGYTALSGTTTGGENTAVGYQALSSNTTGGNNTAVGRNSLSAVTTATANTAMGGAALALNIASNNTAIGYASAFSNTSGTGVVAIGYQAAYSGSTVSGITAIGYQALLNSTGSNNTAVGYQAGLATTTGTANTYLGYLAGNATTYAYDNTAVGAGALLNNVGGATNTAVGRLALRFNSVSNNTAVGTYAGQFNTTGTGLTAIGTQAAQTNTVGINLTAVGYQAAFSSSNADNITAIGYQALYNNTGSNNTAVGTSALLTNTIGANHTAFGFNALYSNTIGVNNSAFGVAALQNNTSGSDNVAIGINSLQNNTTGQQNIAIGISTLTASTTGSYNIAIGRTALFNLTNGGENTALGVTAARYIADGSTALTSANTSIFIGNNTKALANSQSNQIVIGYNVTGLGNNTTVLGNTSTTQTHLFGSTTVGSSTFSPLARLHVVGAGTTSSTTGLLVQNANLSSSLAVLDDGTVGIGTLTTTQKLTVAGGLFLTGSSILAPLVLSDGNYIYGGGTAVSNNAIFGAISAETQIYSRNNKLTIYSAGGSAAYLTSVNGNFGIGIGTNTPAAKLHISGSPGTGSALLIYKSGSTVVDVQGSQGQLFSITDSLSGSLFSVSNISGLPILEVFSDNTVLMGSYQAPSLNTTVRINPTISGSNTVYSLPTASYDGVFVDYTIRSGSNARAGNFTAIWSGSQVNYMDNSTTDFGSTAGIFMSGSISGSNMVVQVSGSAGWTFKGIIRSI